MHVKSSVVASMMKVGKGCRVRIEQSRKSRERVRSNHPVNVIRRRRIIINIVKHASKKAPSKHKIGSRSMAHHVTAVITGTASTMLQEARQELGLDHPNLAERLPSKASRSSDSRRIGRRGPRQAGPQGHPLVGQCPGLPADPKAGLAVVSIGLLHHHTGHCDHYDRLHRRHGLHYCSFPSVRVLA
jgi:hypothetical protein